MELFHKAQAVRLRSHHDKYLLAEEDEESVCQHRRGSSRSARWMVEFVDGSNVLRLKSCYGRYLMASDVPFLVGITGRKVLQSLPRRLDSSVEWEPIKEGSHVKLKSQYGKFLRAGLPIPIWKNSIAHDIPHRRSTQDWVLWEVDVLEIQVESPSPAPMQATSPLDSPVSSSASMSSEMSPKLSKLEPCTSFPTSLPPKTDGRTIYFTIAKDNGEVDALVEHFFTFKGTRVFELTQKLEEETGLSDIIVCFRSHLNGKIYPLQLQLPPNNTSMHVIVVLPSSKGQASRNPTIETGII